MRSEAPVEKDDAEGKGVEGEDHVLDYDGDATVMGKSLGDDLREGKATLPLIAAMQRGTPAERGLIQRAIENGSVTELDAVIRIVRQTGSLDVARQAAALEAERAMAQARRLPAGSYGDSLVQLAALSLGRQT